MLAEACAEIRSWYGPRVLVVHFCKVMSISMISICDLLLGSNFLLCKYWHCPNRELLLNNELSRIDDLVGEKLNADGLIIHVNPAQEWLQPEGDVFLIPPWKR